MTSTAKRITFNNDQYIQLGGARTEIQYIGASTKPVRQILDNDRYRVSLDNVNQLSVGLAQIDLGVELDMNSNRVVGMADATAGDHAVSRGYGDSRYYRSNTTLSSIQAPDADVSFASNKITNLATPTSPSDAVTKDYVDQRVYAPKFAMSYLTADLTPTAENQTLLFDSKIQEGIDIVYTASTGVFTLNQGPKMIDFNMQYNYADQMGENAVVQLFKVDGNSYTAVPTSKIYLEQKDNGALSNVSQSCGSFLFTADASDYIFRISNIQDGVALRSGSSIIVARL